MPTIVETLETNNISFRLSGSHHHVSKGWVGVDCPRCSPGWGKFRLGFELNTGRASCWQCGSTDAVAMFAQVCRISLRESASILRLQPRQSTISPERIGKLVLPTAGEFMGVHEQYLRRRGFDPEEISRVWGVRGIGLHSRLAWRLLIPIFDKFGRTVSWTSRAVSDENPRRYVSASDEEEEVPHKEILYGAHLVRHTVIVVEGPTDAWGIGPGAVATCGVSFTQDQIVQMIEYPIRIVCFDAEDAAQKRAEDLCRQLSAFPGVVQNITLETGKDPAEADKEEILEIRSRFLGDW